MRRRENMGKPPHRELGQRHPLPLHTPFGRIAARTRPQDHFYSCTQGELACVTAPCRADSLPATAGEEQLVRRLSPVRGRRARRPPGGQGLLRPGRVHTDVKPHMAKGVEQGCRVRDRASTLPLQP